MLLPAFLVAAPSTRLPLGTADRLRPLAAPRRRHAALGRCRDPRHRRRPKRRAVGGEHPRCVHAGRRGARASTPPGRSEVAWHALDIAILGLAIPVLAIAALAATVFSRSDTDPALRAFVAVALAYVSLLVVQVGLFAAEYVGHVAERYLITALPLLVIGLCVWISRGAPRAYAVVVPIWVLLVAGAAALHPGRGDRRARDARQHLTPSMPRRASRAVRRGRRSSPAATSPARCSSQCHDGSPGDWRSSLGVGLALASVDSGRCVAEASEHEGRWSMGSAPGAWLDDGGLEDTTLLVTGDRLWTSTARTVFWNRAIADVLLRPRPRGAVPAGRRRRSRSATTACSGRRTASRSTARTWSAPSTVVLAGEKIAERGVDNSETPGLTAWRPDGDLLRVLRRIDGLLPERRLQRPCADHGLRLQAGNARRDDPRQDRRSDHGTRGRVRGRDTRDAGGDVMTALNSRSPVCRRERAPCIFDLQNPGYAGTTTIEFTPAPRDAATSAGERVVGLGQRLDRVARGVQRNGRHEQANGRVAVLARMLVDRALEGRLDARPSRGAPGAPPPRRRCRRLRPERARSRAGPYILVPRPPTTAARRARAARARAAGDRSRSKSRGTTVAGNTFVASSATSDPA